MFSRRSTLAGLGALGGAMALGAPLAARGSPRLPRLRPGDVVGLIAPSSTLDGPEHIQFVEDTVRGMGLVPKTGQNASKQSGYLAGTDEERAHDINAMFADDSVRAIFAIRGGWGSARILPLLDWKTIRANPKLLIGFSDVTALHLAFAARAGFPTLHAPNAGGRWEAESWNSLWRLAFSGEAPILGHPRDPSVTAIRAGKARGRLLGGNLTVLSTLMGTPWLPDFRGSILFLEDVGEAEYRIDRMMNQLALAGVLGSLAGVIFGQCRRCSEGDPDYAGFTVPQILEHYLAPLGVPAFIGANIGHVRNQLSLPVGAKVEIDADEGTIQVLEPIVA